MAVNWSKPVFTPEVDHTPLIRAALDSANPASTLRDYWPWVPEQYRASFVEQATWAPPDELELLIGRYRHVIDAYWWDRQQRRNILVRLLWRLM